MNVCIPMSLTSTTETTPTITTKTPTYIAHFEHLASIDCGFCPCEEGKILYSNANMQGFLYKVSAQYPNVQSIPQITSLSIGFKS